MIRLMLMALGAYTLYRMYVPLDGNAAPKELLSDLRDRPERKPNRTAAGGERS